MHVYDVRPRKDKRGVDLIFDVLPFGRLWYGGPSAFTRGGHNRFDCQSASEEQPKCACD
jgi:hypothetical protein